MPSPSDTVSQPIRRVLMTGATGYIGGRLVPELLDAGYRGPLPRQESGQADRRDVVRAG